MPLEELDKKREPISIPKNVKEKKREPVIPKE